ncbi:MAG: F0F1 ATP synthase subunit gamma [Elusimicrobia bacterium]|nr:F0F1 ATP synthase subunit gamma [Elusimicrobiota bacterium]
MAGKPPGFFPFCPSAFDFIYEPEKEKILEEILPRYVVTQFYRTIFEAYTSEQAGRMNVMENATKNAGELIEGMTLLANKIRQASITRELLEVVSGAEALA